MQLITMPKIDPYGHCGDTFRELVRLWEKNNFVRIEYKNTPHVWWGDIGDIILYDRPLPLWYRGEKNKGILWGNTVPDGGQPWIFWGRRPELIDSILETHGIAPLEERTIESIFLGKIENNIQHQYRKKLNWSDVIENFSMPVNGNYKYSQEDYLKQIRLSKYGLCLRGYGPKCNREVELLAFGTVPIITSDVDLTYYEDLIENKHYIRVDDPSDLKTILSEISDEDWKKMSKEGHEWYMRNCSSEGSFNITEKIINEK